MERTAWTEVFLGILLAEGWTRLAMSTFQGAVVVVVVAVATITLIAIPTKQLPANLFLRESRQRSPEPAHIMEKPDCMEQENWDFWR